MSATPVGSVAVASESSTSASRSPASASSASSSAPTAPSSVTSAPSRAQATAWFAPLPPGMREKVAPVTVSPGRGRRSQRATRSRLIDPTTTMRGATARRLRAFGLRGECAEVVDRRREQRVAEVEQPGPERRAVGRGVEARGDGEAFERAEHDRELEVRGGDPVRARVHTGAVEDRAPFDELPRSRPEVPRPPLRPLRLQLDEVARERLLEARQRRLDAVCGAPEGRLALARGRRLRLSPPPALEQAAERERGHLAGAELGDEARGRLLARGVAFDHGVPAHGQTSITTGRTIGRRRVRSYTIWPT